ncbi:ComF family protein [Pontixanthobacter aestiaquae]
MCAPCLANPPRHDGIAAGTLYNDASRKLILAFKHGRRIALADMLAKLIEARLPKLEGDWLIIPVPLHRTRLWARGFNQAGLLAQNLAKATGHQLVVDGLKRSKRTESLGGLGRKAREKALAGSIIINPVRQEQFAGAQILLVDDVLTSGATSDMCVKTLRRAKADRVVIACFARVLDEALEHRITPESETPEVRKPRAPRDE